MSRAPRSLRWIAEPRDKTVADALVRLGVPSALVASGAVFLGKERVRRLDRTLRPGDCVLVHQTAPRVGAEPAPAPVVLQQQGGVIAVFKPAGLPTIPDERASESLQQWVAGQVGLAASRVHPSSRLDRDVTGVVTFALDARARDLLHDAREQGLYARRYVALVGGALVGGALVGGAPGSAPLADAGTWDAPIGRTQNPRHRAANGTDPKPARSRFRRVAQTAGAQLLALEPVTGRTHQLRVHCAHAGAGILGDRVYGGGARLTAPSGAVLQVPRVMLHAAAVRISAPALDFEVRAKIPDDMRALWLRLGGEPLVWDTAESWEFIVASGP
jgi:23S rRNA pseudouridine1911/1915/1917 synthase